MEEVVAGIWAPAAEAAARGGERPLLRAGRALAAGDAGGLAPAGGAPGGAAGARALRGPDGGGAGGAARVHAGRRSRGPRLRRWCRCRGMESCRCPSRSSGCGSSSSSSPVVTRTTSPIATRLKGRLDVAVLERSLGEIVRRHEALRTTFVGGEWAAGAADCSEECSLVLAVESLEGCPRRSGPRQPAARGGGGAAAVRPGAGARWCGRGCCAWRRTSTCCCS